MPPLADTQAAIRGAIVDRHADAILPRLIGGGDTAYRLSIHQRHYTTSLVDALHRRFPAVEWLVGSPMFNAAALDFVRVSPPSKPCITEYGEAFPDFFATRPEAARLPWIAAIGALEWRLGVVSVAIDHPAIGLDAMAAFADLDVDALRLRLQPGLAFLATEWPVDDIVKLHLGGDPPASYVLTPAETRLEIRGARGKFGMTRLDDGAYAFRKALADDRSLADAIAHAEEVDASFDPGTALAGLFGDRLVIDVAAPGTGARQ